MRKGPQLSSNEAWLLKHLLKHAPTPHTAYALQVWQKGDSGKNPRPAQRILARMSPEEFQAAAFGLENHDFLDVFQASGFLRISLTPVGRQYAHELLHPDLIECLDRWTRRNRFLASLRMLVILGGLTGGLWRLGELILSFL